MFETSHHGSVSDALSIALEERDRYSHEHCDRVSMLAAELGKAFRISNSELTTLRISARQHDIGKIGIPDSVLLKSGSLTPDEWEIMKTHSARGEHIFRMTDHPYVDVIAPVIRHHHESMDGSGYPDGLKGEQIPYLSRLLRVVDAYDAMASSRPYHQGRPHDEIISILDSESGQKIDPYILRQFHKVIKNSPARVN